MLHHLLATRANNRHIPVSHPTLVCIPTLPLWCIIQITLCMHPTYHHHSLLLCHHHPSRTDPTIPPVTQPPSNNPSSILSHHPIPPHPPSPPTPPLAAAPLPAHSHHLPFLPWLQPRQHRPQLFVSSSSRFKCARGSLATSSLCTRPPPRSLSTPSSQRISRGCHSLTIRAVIL